MMKLLKLLRISFFMEAGISGALTIAIEIKEGSHDVAPNSDKEGRDCFVKTIPVIKPVSAIKGRDLTPIT
jgi:hypothetical protein